MYCTRLPLCIVAAGSGAVRTAVPLRAEFLVPLCDDGGHAAVWCAGRWSVFARSLLCVRAGPCVFELFQVTYNTI